MIAFKTISSFRSRLIGLLPQNGPLQQLDIADEELKCLVREFICEAQQGLLKDYQL